jgi:hypothetical protein
VIDLFILEDFTETSRSGSFSLSDLRLI